MYTKRQIVEFALDALGLGPDVYTVTPEDLLNGLRRLEAMMAAWSATGLRMGYQFGESPAADSGLPASAFEGVALSLAIKLAPSYGKTVGQDLRIEASRAKIAIDAIFSPLPPLMGLPAGIPMGAGQTRAWPGYSRFSGAPADPVTRGPNGDTQET